MAIPLQLSLSDQTSLTFDPFADFRKTNPFTQNINAGGGGFDVATYLPIIIMVIVGLIAWKFLK